LEQSAAPKCKTESASIKRTLRVCAVGVAVAAPVLASNLWIDNFYLQSFSSWSIWCVVAWTAMQGPGRWRAAVAGGAYGLVLAVLGLLLWSRFQPEHFASWHTFWRLDFPSFAFSFVKAWALFRIVSLITGIEIADPLGEWQPRWGLRRWFLLMVALAILLQVIVSEMNWYAEITKEFAADSNVGPMPMNPLTRSRNAWLAWNMATMLTIPIVPLLLAGWMLAGRPWRWTLFPFLGAMVVGVHAAAQVAMQFAAAQAPWFQGFSGLLQKDWTLFGMMEWIAYGVAAMLVPWMGFRWIDYWSIPNSRLPSKIGTTEQQL